jgi:FkbM family methyltransferase
MKRGTLPTINKDNLSPISDILDGGFKRKTRISRSKLIMLASTFVLAFISIGHLVSHVKKNQEPQKTMKHEFLTISDFCQNLDEKSNDRTTVANIGNLLNGIQPFSIEIYNGSDIVSSQIKANGSWDLSKLKLFQKTINDYSTKEGIPLNELTFVDIGSNIGWFSLSIAAMGLNVMAFEPMSFNNDMMKRSLCMENNIKSGLSQRVQLFTNGLGPKEESCLVFSANHNEGDGHTLCGKTESEVQILPGHSIRGKIDVKRLDDIASSEGKKIALLKIDVEGYESHVVEGGRDFILNSKIPCIIAEFVPEWIRSKLGDPERMINRFYDAGYKIQNNGGHDSRDRALLDVSQYGSKFRDLIFELVEDVKV